MKLPAEFRETLVIAVDDYLENENDNPDAASLAEAVVRCLQHVVEELDLEEYEDIVSRIEEQAEFDESLSDALEYEFNRIEDLDLSGEEVVAVFERSCSVDWVDAEGMEEDLDDFEEDDEDDLFDEVQGEDY